MFVSQIMHDEGGIYLDLDAVVIRPFDTFLNGSYEAVFGHQIGSLLFQHIRS